MKNNIKKFLTFEEQVAKLKNDKKMKIEDENEATDYLKSNNYIQFITPYKIAFARKIENFDLTKIKEKWNNYKKENIFTLKDLFIDENRLKHLYYNDYSFKLLKKINENHKNLAIKLFYKILEIEAKMKTQIAYYIAKNIHLNSNNNYNSNWFDFLKENAPKTEFEYRFENNKFHSKKIIFKYNNEKFFYSVKKNKKTLVKEIKNLSLLFKDFNLNDDNEQRKITKFLNQRKKRIEEYNFLISSIEKKFLKFNFIWKDIEKFEFGLLNNLLFFLFGISKDNKLFDSIFPSKLGFDEISNFLYFTRKLRNHIAHQGNLQYFYLKYIEKECFLNIKEINKIVFYNKINYLKKVNNFNYFPYRFDIFLKNRKYSLNYFFIEQLEKILNF
ncbi:hypothetical protein ACXX84_02165 [Mycoplasma sp. AC157]